MPGPTGEEVDLRAGAGAGLCTSCGEEAPAEATWCEACGHELSVAATTPCVSCGERVVSPDGYCLSCGQRQPRERDHLRVIDGPVVAVSDRGRRHHHNEDAVAVGWVPGPSEGVGQPGDEVLGGGTAVVVVCDGVSSTAGSAEASIRAAVAARDALMTGVIEAGGSSGAGERSELDAASLLVGAAGRAQQEASAVVADESEPTSPVDDGPPSSTLVAVVARPVPVDGSTELTVAWVGDSRAYWVGPDGPVRLTGDDHEVAGSLIRWLGADSVDPTPEVVATTVRGPGHLVVCTDGLWRYAGDASDMGALVTGLLDAGRAGLDLAEAMVDHANEHGGHDNITVALWSDRPDWPDADHDRDHDADPEAAAATAPPATDAPKGDQ